jgi:hypothetical protein
MATDRLGALPLTVLLFLAPRAANGQSIDASTTAMSLGLVDPRDGVAHSVDPNVLSLSLTASNLKTPYADVRIVVSGWGAATAGQPADPHVLSGDLDVAYVEASALNGERTLRAGRQFIVTGSAQMLEIDGAAFTAAMHTGPGVTLFGGAPTVPRFATALGDAVGGARAFYRFAFDTEIGASYIYLLDHGLVAREDAGVDGRAQLTPKLNLSGFALVSVIEQRLVEANITAGYQLLPNLLFSIDGRQVSPDLYLLRSSILSVFTEETEDEGGGQLFWQPHDRVGISADYHVVFEPSPEGVGHRAGTSIRFRLGPDRKTQVGVEGRLLYLPTNGYWQARAFATQRLWDRAFITLESDNYFFQQPVNGVRQSITGTVAAGYEFTPGWTATISGMAGETPFLFREVQGMAKVTWTPSYHIKEKVK